MSNSLHQLHSLLQKALEIELFTIPPYLTALYSIKEGQNPAAIQIIQSVVMEEMLHVTLVANVMNAVGATPRLSPDLVNADPQSACRLEMRRYPSRVPHVNLRFEVPLARFSQSAIKTFMKIEEPENPNTWVPAGDGSIASIGHFYDVLLERLIATCVDLGEAKVFAGDPSKQVKAEHYYGAGGNVVPVYNLAIARDVIAEIAQQGEGRKISNLTGDHERFGQPKEVAHYFRFAQLLAGRFYDRDDEVDLQPSGPELPVNWAAVYPMQENPWTTPTRPPGIQKILREFDGAYRDVLRRLHEVFNSQPSSFDDAIIEMQRLMNRAVALMRVEVDTDRTHGPPFWYVELTCPQQASK